MMTGGNETCFLFNLQQNLRFNAVPKKKNYLSIQTESEETSDQRTVIFGDTALTMSQNFKMVTSEIKSSSNADAKFIFGDELMQ